MHAHEHGARPTAFGGARLVPQRCGVALRRCVFLSFWRVLFGPSAVALPNHPITVQRVLDHNREEHRAV